MDFSSVTHRQHIIDGIAQGKEDLSKTHVPLSSLLGGAVGASAALLQQLPGAAAGMPLVAAAAAQPAIELQTPAAAAAAAAAGVPGDTAAAAQSASAAAAADLHSYAAALGLQIFRLEQLQQHAEAAEQVKAAGRKLQPHQMAVVPDATRPFTLTMQSGFDGVEYVVAHYEPAALQHSASKLAALLCAVGVVATAAADAAASHPAQHCLAQPLSCCPLTAPLQMFPCCLRPAATLVCMLYLLQPWHVLHAPLLLTPLQIFHGRHAHSHISCMLQPAL
jgi:hypothetical protein